MLRSAKTAWTMHDDSTRKKFAILTFSNKWGNPHLILYQLWHQQLHSCTCTVLPHPHLRALLSSLLLMWVPGNRRKENEKTKKSSWYCCFPHAHKFTKHTAVEEGITTTWPPNDIPKQAWPKTEKIKIMTQADHPSY